VTIDERLEKLTERHEALAQTMELMVAENRERDGRLDKLAEDVSKVSDNMNQLITTVDRVVGSVEKLTLVVANHQVKLRNLEGK
jgi:hypothetical protein